MLDKIKAFKQDAEKLCRDKNSISELKMWLYAGLRAPEGIKWTRKPTSIDEIGELDNSRWSPAKEGSMAAFLDDLETFPIEEVIKDPEGYFLDEFMQPMDQYFILESHDGKYLVNTEGSDYARYVVKLPQGW